MHSPPSGRASPRRLGTLLTLVVTAGVWSAAMAEGDVLSHPASISAREFAFTSTSNCGEDGSPENHCSPLAAGGICWKCFANTNGPDSLAPANATNQTTTWQSRLQDSMVTVHKTYRTSVLLESTSLDLLHIPAQNISLQFSTNGGLTWSVRLPPDESERFDLPPSVESGAESESGIDKSMHLEFESKLRVRRAGDCSLAVCVRMQLRIEIGCRQCVVFLLNAECFQRNPTAYIVYALAALFNSFVTLFL